MGNCQAMEVATVVIQHPGGRVERLYWPTTAEELMRSNPGHCVALVTLCVAEQRHDASGGGTVRFTRVRLLKPNDTLLLGQAYRLVTTQEVTKALRARKNEKMRTQSELIKKQQLQPQQQRRHQLQQRQQQQLQSRRDDLGVELPKEARQHDAERIDQGAKQERDGQRNATPAVRARQWRPSLQSISEVGS